MGNGAKFAPWHPTKQSTCLWCEARDSESILYITSCITCLGIDRRATVARLSKSDRDNLGDQSSNLLKCACQVPLKQSAPSEVWVKAAPTSIVSPSIWQAMSVRSSIDHFESELPF